MQHTLKAALLISTVTRIDFMETSLGELFLAIVSILWKPALGKLIFALVTQHARSYEIIIVRKRKTEMGQHFNDGLARLKNR